MQIEQSAIEALAARPTEGLNVELKRWIDPDSSVGIEKIVKAALALRNRNGGYIVIGFDDNTRLPDVGHEPDDVRKVFHLDKIQALVSRYSSELFEIGVGFATRDGIDYPVIVVPSGVKTIVAAKRDLIDGGKPLIRLGAVYFRTLAANGTPSTAEARPEDWREMLEICFDNREADVGRFLRRQLSGVDISTLIAAFRELGLTHDLPAPPTLRQRAEDLLGDGERRFQLALRLRSLDQEGQRLATAGSWHVALIIEPPKTGVRPDRTFSSKISASNPNLTGWPIWIDATGSPENRMIVKEGVLEALIYVVLASSHLDFHRFDPKGEFYLRRVLQDDAIPSRVPPGTALDPIIVVLRVAEAIVVGITFAKALGWPQDSTRLGFAFRWEKLSGRSLSSWSDPYGGVDWGQAHDDEVTTYTELSLDTPTSAIAPYVTEATQDLFVLFNGHTLTPGVVEDWVQRLIERRLNR